MRLSVGTVCVWALCSVLLAACGGGGGGGTPEMSAGMAQPPAQPMQPVQPAQPAQPVQPTQPAQPPVAQPQQPMEPMEPMVPMVPMEPMEPPFDALAYGTYGAWNQAIRNTFPQMATCPTAFVCDNLFPALTGTIVSPFGATEAYVSTTDNWTATWSGGIEGWRHGDPDSVGTGDGRRFTGEAKLKIRSTDRAHVDFWAENMRFRLEDGVSPGSSAPPPFVIPHSEAGALELVLSTAAGEKGYFSHVDARGEVHGQFAVPETGETVPGSAAGHLKRSGYTAVFEVTKE